MTLVDRNHLGLDRPLYTYLPNPDIAYDERYKLITARMVLSHTSGFPNWRFLNEDGRLDLKFVPGTAFLYSGEGYEYLAEVVAALHDVGKNGLQSVMKEQVFDPLGMKHAYFVWTEYVEDHQATGHVDGTVAGGWGLSAEKPDFGASYSLQTNARDFSQFLVAVLNGSGLSPEMHEEMLEPQTKTDGKMDESKWALGIGIRPAAYGDAYVHGGYNRNFAAGYLLLRSRRFGYVFLTNSNGGLEFGKRLEAYLLAE
jgi:CubicO group peptidase (beta-lactamase class C family)